MRYIVGLGAANTGGTPTVSLYVRTDTMAALPSPTLNEIGTSGQFYWDVDWTTITATSIAYQFTLNGAEVEGVVEAPSAASSGAATASAASYSTDGFQTVGPLVARAAIQCNLFSLSRSGVLAYDPFTSTDAEVLRLLEHLDALGMDLASEVQAHLHREFTITTAGSATSYAMPADFVELVPDSLWNRGQSTKLLGPATPQRAQSLKAWTVSQQVRIDFRLQGNLLTFPVAPADGLTIAGEYVSRNWIQTAGSGTGPDADHVTAATDYVRFDPTLVVLGLRYRWLSSKGYPQAALALAEYEKRLEWAKGTIGSAPVLDLGGGSGGGFRFIDSSNVPDTGYGE